MMTRPRIFASVPAAALALAIAGCSTAEQTAEFSPADQYPNLNIRPQPAAEQFTPQERQASAARLKALRARQPAGSSAPAGVDAERLRRLARTHGEQAIEEIESE